MPDETPTGLSGDMTGPYGRAQRIPFNPDQPEAAHTVDFWLLDIPGACPAWNQYMLACVRLNEVEGAPPPHLQFDGATHELMVYALDPCHPVTRDEMAAPGYRSHPLSPVNVSEQFIATDEEMRLLCQFAARACVEGHLTPEPVLSGSREWLQPLVKTLAHIRGEVHAP